MNSPLSSAVSVSSVPSVISDIIPLANLGENEGTTSDYSTSRQESDTLPGTLSNPIIPRYHDKLFFEPGDGDVKLCVNGTYFETHKYLLKRFNVLKSQLCRHPLNAALNVPHDKYDAEDFEHTLGVLYATVLEGPFEFDSATLVSALRIATAYDYPDLCSYATKHLESANLIAIERIKVAREFGLTSWEEPAYLELCERDKPITSEEASALGMDVFVRIAGIREREQRRRGREIGAAEEQNAETEALNNGHSATNADSIQMEGQGNMGASSSESSQDDARTTNGMMTPSFIGIQTSGEYAYGTWMSGYKTRNLLVPDCTCRLDSGTSSGATPAQCTLSACALAAFKNLQMQQLAHTNSITNLEHSMDKLNASLAPTPESPAKIPNPPHGSIREEVGLMLNALRRT